MQLEEALEVLSSFEYGDLSVGEFVKRYPTEDNYWEALRIIKETLAGLKEDLELTERLWRDS